MTLLDGKLKATNMLQLREYVIFKAIDHEGGIHSAPDKIVHPRFIYCSVSFMNLGMPFRYVMYLLAETPWMC